VIARIFRLAALAALVVAAPACNGNGAFDLSRLGTVVVHVVDTGGAGVGGALVRLQLRAGLGGTFFLDGQTQADGSYSYGGVEPGLVPVSVTPPTGYTSTQPLFTTLSVAAGDTVQTTFVLTKS
jgi:hypothetical protein